MRKFDKFYIDGNWVDPSGSAKIEVLSSSSEEVMGEVPNGNASDAEAAIAAARRAFDGHWGETSVEERGGWIAKLAGGLQERMMDISSTISEEVGTPITMAMAMQGGLPIMVTSSYCDILPSVE